MGAKKTIVTRSRPITLRENGSMSVSIIQFSKVFDRQSLVIGNKPLCEKANGGGKD